jgi:glycosyltransferase involved in cell wall biosynthesis
LFAGKLEPKKRPMDLLRGFADANVPNTTLLLVGSGSERDALVKAATSIPNVVFAPFQNQTQMPRVYAAADLFVLPSLGGGESWGLAVNEAMCLGKPIVVSSHVGCAEDLVEPFVNGLVFPAGDIAGLTSALREALSDDERLKEWGRASLRKVKAYSYEAATRGLVRAVHAVSESA